jgi:plastocyanin
MRRTLFVVTAALALVGAACSSSSSTPDTGGGDTASTSTAACTADTATDLSGDDPFTITIKDLAYEPACATVSSAAGIVIENEDATAHTFTIDGTPVDIELAPNKTVTGEPPAFAPATYQVHCNIHASMAATLIVVA